MNAKIDVTNLKISTERLVLREWYESDLDDFYEYASVMGVGEMAGWPHHENKDKSKERLDKFIKEKKTFALVYKSNNKVIGSLGIEEYALEDKLSEFYSYQGRSIGYVLSKSYWGQGLMVEALKAVMEYLYNTLNYDFLLCGHFDSNKQSRRVQEKCGFTPYRKLVFDTKLGHVEPGVLNIHVNPNKHIRFIFSHPETLIINPINLRDRSIKTSRLLLSSIKDEDYDDFVYLFTNKIIKQTYMLPEINSKEEMEIFFKKIQGITLSKNVYAYGIYLQEKLIGFINEVGSNKQEIEIGYFIDPNQWNHGYASEALLTVINDLFSLGFSKILAAHFKDNIASGRVMEKCGMRKNSKIVTVDYLDKKQIGIYYEIRKNA